MWTCEECGAENGDDRIECRSCGFPQRAAGPVEDSGWTCAKCNASVKKQFDACWQCGSGRDGTSPENTAVFEETLHEEKLRVARESQRYQALRIIAGMFKVLAWLTASVCVIAGIMGIVAAQKMASSGFGRGAGGLGVLGLLGYLLAGAIGFVSFYATAESILVFLDIEENTRATRSLTQKTLEAIGRLLPRPGREGTKTERNGGNDV